MCSPSKWFTLTHAFLYFVCVCVCVCVSFWIFLLVCLSFCLRHFHSLYRFIFLPFSLLIYIMLSPFFLFSVHSASSCAYEHTYFMFNYLVCTHFPLIYFTNKEILLGDFSISGFQMQQFFAWFPK